jgi:outer membrane murein-binding lipoprotein Lpp
MKEESAHLVQGLQEVEKLQKRVGNVEKMNGNMQNMGQHLAGLEEFMQQMIQKQQAAGTNNSRVNEGLRNGRGRSADDAKRQGMHVSPLGKNSQASLNSKLLSERLLWQQIHAQALDEVKSSMHTIQKELDPYGQDEVVRRKQERDALMQKVLRNSTSMSTDSLEARGMQRLRPFQHRT